MELSQKIADWIKQKVTEARAKGCVLGLSGGVDSAVAALLCKKVFPKDTLALILPCHSLSEDIKDAQKFAKKFAIQTKVIDLTMVFESLFIALAGTTYKDEMDLPIANLKPRLRMLTLYYFANKMNYLVVGTGNRSELAMGYFTKYGDGGVDILPLGDLLKSEVKQLAEELGVPREIVDKAPSAGLWAGQTDEGEMGITYTELDKVLLGELKGISQEKIDLINNRETLSRHKRALPDIFKK